MKIRTMEFHVHTKYSQDSILTKWFLLWKCKRKKIDCLAITDHNSIQGAFTYKDFFARHGILIVVGEEIFTKSGEIIGLFLTKKIEPNLSVAETIEEIKKQKGIVYVPHPYDLKRYKTVLKKEELIQHAKDIDLIEIHNGRNLLKEYSVEQKKIADETKISYVIGSDAHSMFELGRNYIQLEQASEVTPENLVDLVKTSHFQTKDCISWIHTYTKFVRGWKLLWKGDFNGIYRAINKKCRRKK